jgi:hypothetical protein
MLRLLFWILLVGLVVAVLDGALPMPGVADEEIVYTTDVPVSTCGTSGCIVVYTLEVGNVGRSTQENVRVRLKSDALASPVVAPTVRRSSEATAAATANDRPGVDIVPLGRLAPEERVALVFALRAGSHESAPGWDRLLVGVDPTVGAARPGDVGGITLGRCVNASGRVVHRVVSAVRQAIASR